MKLKDGGALIARGCLTRSPPLETQYNCDDADLKRWMLEIMLLMGWRELLERLQLINVQGIRQGEVGYLLSPDVAHKIK